MARRRFLPGVFGALLALLDGCVWAELGAAMPQAGGSYVFLREAYGPQKFGRLMSFLFIWQTLFQAPLSISSGALGFADYSKYLTAKVPGFGAWHDAHQASMPLYSGGYVRVGRDRRHRHRRRAALPPHLGDRHHLHRSVGNRARHHALADLRRSNALQTQPASSPTRPAPGRFPGRSSPASATPPCKPSTATSATTTSAISAAR